jgi:two-component system chemotaxis response regulator CheY
MAKRYSLIISDWNMEPMTGYQLLQKVRIERPDVPFIMVTAESKTDNIIAARRAGVSQYVVKPFNAEILKAKIDAVFSQAAA